MGMKFGLLFGCLIKKIKPCDCPPASPPVPGGSQLVAGWVPKALRNSIKQYSRSSVVVARPQPGRVLAGVSGSMSFGQMYGISGKCLKPIVRVPRTC